MSVAKVVEKREVLSIRLSYAALLLLVVAVIYAKGWFFLFGDLLAVISNVPDDVGYFYKIALNVVQGKGLSFDGINLTNGFQPLWLYMLLPLAWLMHDAPVETYFRAALIYQMLMVIIAGLVLFRAVRLVTSYSVALISTAIFYLFSRGYFINGMETGVLMLCVAVLLAYTFRYRAFSQPNPRVAAGFGVLAGLLLLARLDMIFLVGISYAVIIARAVAVWRRNAGNLGLIQDALISLLALVVVVAPYFVYNKLVFGAMMPISGQLKNSFPHAVQPEFGLERYRPRDLFAVGVAAGFCVWAIFTGHRWRTYPQERQYFSIATLVCALTVVIHYLNTALFMKWAVFAWHFAFYYFTLCLIVGMLTLQFYTRWRQMTALVAIVLASWGTLHTLMKAGEQHSRRSWRSVAYEAALWARQNTPPNTVFAMKDAGIFGLFSLRPVINLDGLVNNMEYQEALRQRKLNRYLAENGVQYLVQHAMWDDAEINRVALTGEYEFIDFPYRSQRYGNWSDPVRLYRTDEVFRSSPYYDGEYRTVFLIWRLRHNLHNEHVSR